MDNCRDEPDRKARTKYEPKGQLFLKAYKSHEEK